MSFFKELSMKSILTGMLFLSFVNGLKRDEFSPRFFVVQNPFQC